MLSLELFKKLGNEVKNKLQCDCKIEMRVCKIKELNYTRSI